MSQQDAARVDGKPDYRGVIGGLMLREPVMVTAFAGSIVAYVLSLLVTHGILTDTQASTWSEQLVPIAAAGLTLLVGFIARHFTAPWLLVKAQLERSGLLSDADWGRLEALFGDLIQNQLHLALAAAQSGVPPAPASLNADNLPTHPEPSTPDAPPTLPPLETPAPAPSATAPAEGTEAAPPTA